jgi:hypothetical protein
MASQIAQVIEKRRDFSVHLIDAYTLRWRVSGARRVLLQP